MPAPNPNQHMPATLVRPPFEPTWALIKRPLNYPGSDRVPGKIAIIWEKNSKSLYHRLSPYSQYDENQGLIKGFTKEPFYYTYIDEKDNGLPSLRKYESRLFPIGSAPIDVVRVAKFMGSGRGIPFLAKQFLLQTGNVYNETRIYNPTSPLIAAGMGLALGSVRPMRHIDTSGGLVGVATSLLGSAGGAIASSIFGKGSVNPPAGTVGGGLPDVNIKTGGKGLLRASTANTGKANLEAAWPQAGMGGGLNKSFGSVVKGLVKSIFANFIPQRQGGIETRSDEGAYGLMLGTGPTAKFSYRTARDGEFEFGPVWFAGGKVIRKTKQTPHSYKIFVKYDKNGTRTNEIVYSQEGFDQILLGVGQVGYRTKESTDANKPGMRYGDNVGESISTRNGDEYANSDVMRQFANYADPAQQFPTKRSDVDLVRLKNRQMTILLDKIRHASEGPAGAVYVVDVPAGSNVFTSDKQSDSPAGYDRLFKKKNKDPNKATDVFLRDYKNTNITLVSNDVAHSRNKSYKLPTAGWFDAINTLEVLDKDREIPINKMRLREWYKWEPYKDDLIALYFYDVVNEKYIPFRASIKGLQESLNASWEEMSFIGRGDKLYSYGGFNRNLSININVNINSLVELAPTWQRINYLATLVKPANYTTTISDYRGEAMNRFMVPPMVMLTVGDLYTDQPILIQSVVVNIPDDAIWEIQHQTGAKEDEWTHLVDYIKTPANAKVLYGQLPRTIDIAVTAILIEKERAVVGGANFGHAPRTDEWVKWNTSTVPNGGEPSKLHQSFVVNTVEESFKSTNPQKIPNDYSGHV